MKIYIILKSFQKELINHTLLSVIEQLKNTNCKIFGVIFLPLKIKKFCVLRSPQIDNDSREHLEIRTYKCFINTDLTTIEQIDKLLKLEIPEGIYCNFKTII